MDDEEIDGSENGDGSTAHPAWTAPGFFTRILAKAKTDGGGEGSYVEEIGGLPSAAALQEALLESVAAARGRTETSGDARAATSGATSATSASASGARPRDDSVLDEDLTAAIVLSLADANKLSMATGSLPSPPYIQRAPSPALVTVGTASSRSSGSAVGSGRSTSAAAGRSRKGAAPAPTTGPTQVSLGVSGYEPLVPLSSGPVDEDEEGGASKAERRAERKARQTAIAAAVASVREATVAAATGTANAAGPMLIPRRRLGSDGSIAPGCSDEVYRAYTALHGHRAAVSTPLAVPPAPLQSAAAAADAAHSSRSASSAASPTSTDQQFRIRIKMASPSAAAPAAASSAPVAEAGGQRSGRKRPREALESVPAAAHHAPMGRLSMDLGLLGPPTSAAASGVSSSSSASSSATELHPPPLTLRRNFALSLGDFDPCAEPQSKKAHVGAREIDGAAVGVAPAAVELDIDGYSIDEDEEGEGEGEGDDEADGQNEGTDAIEEGEGFVDLLTIFDKLQEQQQEQRLKDES